MVGAPSRLRARTMTSTPPSNRYKKKQAKRTLPSNDTAFRSAERYWKNRAEEPDLSKAFTCDKIHWEGTDDNGRVKGYWIDDLGTRLDCIKVRLEQVVDFLGQTKWKGKLTQQHDYDFAVIIPSMPGLVLLPSILPPPVQRSLVRECLRHSLRPNLTSLTPHYALPDEGIWNAFESGQGEKLIDRISPRISGAQSRQQVDFEPVNKENWKEVKGRGEKLLSDGMTLVPPEATKEPDEAETAEAKENQKEKGGEVEASAVSIPIKELLPKLRWTTIGWNYDWTSKIYDFDAPHTALPPLIHQCCRDGVRSVPWRSVFDEKEGEEKVWQRWNEHYDPDAGIVNFYQLRDTLTAHIDQSEIDAVQPLVSYSIGHSAIFLIGGPTRDTAPLPILLRSGDGLIMSGQEGRRVFHGIPRILSNSLPEYLDSFAEIEQGEESWELFGEFLEPGARININVRTVFST